MNIENLNLETRTEIHNFTKKILRNYYKGLKSGKHPTNLFVESILESENPPNWLKDNIHLKDDSEFKQSYIDYILKIVLRYKDLEIIYKLQDKKTVLNNSKDKKVDLVNSKDKKSDFKHQIILKNKLKEKGYKLTIPPKYLTEKEINYMLEFLNTGNIPVGHERVYNYIEPIS